MSYFNKKYGVHTIDSAQEQRQQKTLPYTITTIKSLETWKVERKRLDDEEDARIAARFLRARSTAESIVSEQSRTLALTDLERREMDYKAIRDGRVPNKLNYDTSKAHIEPEYWRLYRESLNRHEPPAPPPSLWQRAKGAWCRIWRNAVSQ